MNTTETPKKDFLPRDGEVLYVPASKYNIESQFMKYKPITYEEKDLHSELTAILHKKNHDFTVIGCTEINAIGHSKSWLSEEIRHINRKAHFADYHDYLLILAYHLDELMLSGITVQEAWRIISSGKFMDYFTNTPFLYLNSSVGGYMIVGGFSNNHAKNPWLKPSLPNEKSKSCFSYCGYIPLIVK